MTTLLTSEREILSLRVPRLGFCGGTFDPFTHGHLAVVEAALAGHVDHLVICPHSKNPAKRPSEMRHRINLIQLMVAHSAAANRVSICDPACLEEGTWGQQFLDLAKRLADAGTESRIVVGDDGVNDKYWPPLRQLPHVVFQRTSDLTAVRRILGGPLTYLPPPHPSLPSSTKARALVASGRRYHGFADVHDYIARHRLYGAPRSTCARAA
jgi:cytidyltransferase-like protein